MEKNKIVILCGQVHYIDKYNQGDNKEQNSVWRSVGIWKNI